jgi:glutamate-1-semialdehyde 2,1-aminomutase
MLNLSAEVKKLPKHPLAINDFQQEYSASCLERARQFIPQGVGSPGRAFDEVVASPIFVSLARGSRLWDVDGNELIDFMNGLGPVILGHGNDAVLGAVMAQLRSGTVHALCSELEWQLAGMIAESTPEIEKVRFACSGTEAVMTAIRLARLITNRPKIVKFRGAYHGHSDPVLAPLNDSDNAVTGEAVWKGIPQATVRQTVYADYNDIAGVKSIFAKQGNEVAAVLVEPVATNMGLVPGTEDFLKSLRALCSEFGALLICDEVVNGFRFHYGAYSQDVGFAADLYAFGKIIGGGLPIGAVAGPAKHMDWLERHSSVFHSGTFAGNPLTMAGGIAVLKQLRDGDAYEILETLGAELEDRVTHELKAAGSPYGFMRRGSLFSFILVPGRTRLYNHSDVAKQDTALFAKLHHALLRQGILIPPTIEEPGFISYAHSIEDVRDLARAVGEVLSEARE